MASEIRVVDNSGIFRDAMEDAVMAALETCGLIAEGYAIDLAPSPGKFGTGYLRNSISHEVIGSEKAVYIGASAGYAPYLELGTGKYVSGGSPPWVYKDDKGNWHRTSGQPAKPFIKPAVAKHESEYRGIIEDTLKGK